MPVRRCALLLIFACLIGLSQSAFIMRGGAPVPGVGCGAIVTPLSGCTLSDPQLGTVSFATTQGAYGYNVLASGLPVNAVSGTRTVGVQATKMTMNGNYLVVKYDTDQAASAPQTQCLQETVSSGIGAGSVPGSGWTLPNFIPATCPGGM